VSEWAGQIRQIYECYCIWFITTWIKADCRLRHLYGACPKTSAPESCPQTRRNTQMVMGPTSSCPDSNDPIRHATCPTNKKKTHMAMGPTSSCPDSNAPIRHADYWRTMPVAQRRTKATPCFKVQCQSLDASHRDTMPVAQRKTKTTPYFHCHLSPRDMEIIDKIARRRPHHT